MRRLSIPVGLLLVSVVVFVATWVAAPSHTLSGVIPPRTIELPGQHAHRRSATAGIITELGPDSSIVDRHLADYPNPVFGSATPFRVAFTFDDGPHHLYTRRLLHVINEYDVRGTFFVNGYWVDRRRHDLAKRNRELVLQIHQQGHIIGNHTYSHQWLPRLTPLEQTRQIMSNAQLLESITGQRPRYFRPPYGSMTAHAQEVLRRAGFLDIRWNAAAEEEHDPDQMARSVMMWLRVHQGGIVMLHDRLPGTAAATRKVLNTLDRENCRRRSQNKPTFQVVSLDSLLRPPAKSVTLLQRDEAERKRHEARLRRVCDRARCSGACR